MSKFLLPFISIQTLLIFFLILHLREITVTAISDRYKFVPENLETLRKSLKHMYPTLKEEGLTRNIKSLIRNLKRRRRWRIPRRSRSIPKEWKYPQYPSTNPLIDIPTTNLPLYQQNRLVVPNPPEPTITQPTQRFPDPNSKFLKSLNMYSKIGPQFNNNNIKNNNKQTPLTVYVPPATFSTKSPVAATTRWIPMYTKAPFGYHFAPWDSGPHEDSVSKTNKFPSPKSISTNKNEKKDSRPSDLQMLFSAMEHLLSFDSRYSTAVAPRLSPVSRNVQRKVKTTKKGNTATTTSTEDFDDANMDNILDKLEGPSKREMFRRDTSSEKTIFKKCSGGTEDDYDYDEEEYQSDPPPSYAFTNPKKPNFEPTVAARPKLTDHCKNAKIHEAIYKNILNSLTKEDLPCNINGYWSSFAGGMLLRIRRRQKSLHIKLLNKTPPCKKGFLLQCGWKFHGRLPFFPKNNIISIVGYNEPDKHVASFIGECRICNGAEAVTGNWLLARASRDCRDQRASEELISDIWKREMLTQLRNMRFKKTKQDKKENTDDDLDDFSFA